MAKPITKNQLADFWFSEFRSPDGGHCGLCGNTGHIDTRGIRTPAGFVCGGQYDCICPNGRAIHQAKTRLKKPKE